MTDTPSQYKTEGLAALSILLRARLSKAQNLLNRSGAALAATPNYQLEENVQLLLTYCQDMVNQYRQDPSQITLNKKRQFVETVLEHMRKSHTNGGIFQFSRFSLTTPSRQQLVYKTLELLDIDTQSTDGLERWLRTNPIITIPAAFQKKSNNIATSKLSCNDDGFISRQHRVSFLFHSPVGRQADDNQPSPQPHFSPTL